MPATGQVAELARGLVNFRDLGGLPTESGAQTRPGVLYRSDGPQPDDSPPADAQVWPPTLVLDLRKPGEGGTGHPLADAGSVVRNIPLMARKATYWDVKDWSAMPNLEELYQEFLVTSQKYIASIVEDLGTVEGPTLVHCAAGKDRTGVLIAVLLRLAGVRRDAAVADYHATDPNMPDVVVKLAIDYSHLEGADRLRAEQLIGTSERAIVDVLDIVDNAPGGPAGWAASHGVSPAALQRWRQRLVG